MAKQERRYRRTAADPTRTAQAKLQTRTRQLQRRAVGRGTVPEDDNQEEA